MSGAAEEIGLILRVGEEGVGIETGGGSVTSVQPQKNSPSAGDPADQHDSPREGWKILASYT